MTSFGLTDYRKRKANNIYGAKGCLKCERCRRMKQACNYEDVRQVCLLCARAELPCGPKQLTTVQRAPESDLLQTTASAARLTSNGIPIPTNTGDQPVSTYLAEVNGDPSLFQFVEQIVQRHVHQAQSPTSPIVASQSSDNSEGRHDPFPHEPQGTPPNSTLAESQNSFPGLSAFSSNQ